MASVLIPLAQGCEELEAITVSDLMRRAQIDVVTAGLDDQIVVASRGTRLIPDTDLSSLVKSQSSFDMIVLPGGLPGADHLNEDARIRKIIIDMHQQGKWIAAICAAPKVLANAGLLEGKKATCYPGSFENYNVPDMIYSTDSVVIDRNIITSRGPGTAMQFALVLIELLCDISMRKTIEKQLLLID